MGVYVIPGVILIRIDGYIEIFSLLGERLLHIYVPQMAEEILHPIHLQARIFPQDPLLELAVVLSHFLDDDDESLILPDHIIKNIGLSVIPRIIIPPYSSDLSSQSSLKK